MKTSFIPKRVLPVLLAGTALGAFAAPTEDLRLPDNAQRPAQQAGSTLREAEQSQLSGTVRMLLQMQGDQPVVDTGPKIPATKSGAATREPVADAKLQQPEFQSVTKPVEKPAIEFINQQARPVVSRPERAPATDGGGNPGLVQTRVTPHASLSTAPQPAAADDEESLLMRAFRLVRTNREWVAGGCLLVLLVVGASAVAGWRRR